MGAKNKAIFILSVDSLLTSAVVQQIINMNCMCLWKCCTVVAVSVMTPGPLRLDSSE